jgi:NAD(P)-dependent dehydrogenase (short-subunit alcohol dehydrogenase family)
MMEDKGLSFLKNQLVDSLNEKTVFIFGANSGVGKQALEGLLELGVKVIAGVRSDEKGNALVNEEKEKGPISYYCCNQDDPLSIKVLADKLADVNIDAFILNAGIFHPKKGTKTKEGLTSTFAINTLGSYRIFTSLITSHPLSRYVFVTSLLAQKPKGDDYSSYLSSINKPLFQEYKISKQAIDDLFLYYLHKGYAVYLTHPGVATTKIYRNLPQFIVKGGDIVLPLLVNPAWKSSLGEILCAVGTYPSGTYFAPSSLLSFKGYPEKKKLPDYDKARSEKLINLLSNYDSKGEQSK